MPITTSATIQITVQLTLRGENWTEQATIEQIHREAETLAIARIKNLCERYVTIIGVPRVQAVLVNKDN
jgi:hypothetical protein